MRCCDLVYFTLLLIVTTISICEYILIKNKKKILDTYERTSKKLHETSEKISKTNDEDEIYSIVLDTIVELIPNATKGSILLINEEGDFYFQAYKGFQQGLENLKIKKEEAYLYKINNFKETAIINNPSEFNSVNTDEATMKGLQDINALDITCTISAPIYIDDKFIGLINVDSEKLDHKFTEKDRNLVNQIKSELELAINNALAQNKLKCLADFDELTGDMNRRILKNEYDKQVKNLTFDKQKLSLVMIDLDNFKFLNDSYGHCFGDTALKHFSTILNNFVQKPDLIARFAGDEFIILFIECDLEMAEHKMQSITAAVSSSKLDEIILKFSYGICEVGASDKMNFDLTLALADKRMYENKKETK